MAQLEVYGTTVRDLKNGPGTQVDESGLRNH